jgi:hypothetical protein
MSMQKSFISSVPQNLLDRDDTSTVISLSSTFFRIEKMSKLRERLRPYGFDLNAKLAEALGTSRQYAHQLLRGDPFGPRAAKRIAAVISLPWEMVYSWQDSESPSTANTN